MFSSPFWSFGIGIGIANECLRLESLFSTKRDRCDDFLVFFLCREAVRTGFHSWLLVLLVMSGPSSS